MSSAEEMRALVAELELRIVQRIQDSYRPIWEEIRDRGKESKQFEKEVGLGLRTIQERQGTQSDQLQQHMTSDEQNFGAMKGMMQSLREEVSQLQVDREVARQVAKQVGKSEGTKAAKEETSRSAKVVSSVVFLLFATFESLEQCGFFDWVAGLVRGSGN